MPELPEVQTIVTDLKKVLPGLKIRDVWTDFARMIKSPKSFANFKRELVGRKILDVKRRGKNILINLSGNRTLLLHLKMTGRLLYEARNSKHEIRKFVHLVFCLSNNKELAFSDVRKFGKALVWPTDNLDKLKDIKDIGPDPLSKDFTFKKFCELLSERSGKIKDVLMKQEIVAGIGNIYSSEILWEAGLHPFEDVKKIKENEWRKLYAAVIKILKQGVKLRGDSMVDYRDAFGRKGKYQNFHKAYQREGKSCPRKDGGVIKRIRENGRSAFFCSVHQKLK